MNPRAVLAGSIVLLAAALACTLGSAAPTATPDLAATITAQAQALEARTGETATIPTGTIGAPTTAAATATPQPPSAPQATKTRKPTKTASPATNTPVPTLSVPQMPANLAVAGTSCGHGLDAYGSTDWKAVVTLSWEDSDTETAYRLYRNGTAYTTVILQDAVMWPVSVEYPYNASNAAEYDYFELEAYNSAGASPKASVYSYHCHY
jgi:hypothetical protein